MRRWIGLIAALAAIAVMVTVIYGIGRGVLSLLNGLDTDAGEPDPMYDLFPGELSRETRPPELAEEDGADAPVAVDRLDSWVYTELNPVEKTAGELAGEQD